MRYAWDLQSDYLRGRDGLGLRGLAIRLLLHYLRLWDSRTANGVDVFVANSSFVAKRIRKVYGRDVTVIYPPIDVESFAVEANKEGFYLCASRLMPYKRVDLVIEAFRSTPDRQLVVIGDGPERRKLMQRAPKNVSFLGYQTDESLKDYMKRARALVFAAVEDFGILPVEAQACGTPVIAYGKGGCLETVVPLGDERPTGIFFKEQSAESIMNAVLAFEQNSGAFTAQSCRQNAERFSQHSFRTKFQQFVEHELTSFKSRH
jgi:glycosyltransferase involved in cell wall biosynthesis